MCSTQNQNCLHISQHGTSSSCNTLVILAIMCCLWDLGFVFAYQCLFIAMRTCWQVQKLKVDLESAMLEMDQILKSNELSIALVAAIPALLVAGAAITLLVRWLTPRPPDTVFEALPCRCAAFPLNGHQHCLQRYTCS